MSKNHFAIPSKVEELFVRYDLSDHIDAGDFEETACYAESYIEHEIQGNVPGQGCARVLTDDEKTRLLVNGLRAGLYSLEIARQTYRMHAGGLDWNSNVDVQAFINLQWQRAIEDAIDQADECGVDWTI